MGNIKNDFGIDFELELDDSANDIERFCSIGQYSINPRLKGDISAGGIKFAKSGLTIDNIKPDLL